MNTIIEKIRTEVNRLNTQPLKPIPKITETGYHLALKDVLFILSNLEKEVSAKIMKENELQIVCILSDTLRVGLKDIRENNGHDDSIPFQAEVYIQEGPKESDYRHVASVWNDGWGGDSEMRRTDREPETATLIEKAQTLCKVHSMVYQKQIVAKYSLKLLCSCMAEGWLYCSERKKVKTVLYRFDDDPVTLKNNGANLYKLY